jgi:hypothetical protein
LPPLPRKTIMSSIAISNNTEMTINKMVTISACFFLLGFILHSSPVANRVFRHHRHVCMPLLLLPLPGSSGFN